MCPWSMFRPRLRSRLARTDALKIFVYCSRAPGKGEGEAFVPCVNDLDGPGHEYDEEVAEEMDGFEQSVNCVRVGLNQMSDYVKVDRLGTTRAGDDEEEDDDGFYFIVKRKIDDEGVYRFFVRCNAAPDDPDGHDTLHVTLALGHRSCAWLTTITCRGSRNL